MAQLVTLQEMKSYLGIPGINYSTVTVNLEIDIDTQQLIRATGTWGTEIVVGAFVNLNGFSNAQNNVQVVITNVVSTTVLEFVGPGGMLDEVGIGTSYDREDEASDTTYDTFLTGQIEIISDTIEAYCRRIFASATYTQTIYYEDLADLKPSRELNLFHFPLSAVASVELDGVPFTEYRIHSSGKLVLDNSSYYGGSYWQQKFKSSLVVEYTAGLASTPNPVKTVVYTLVGERYSKKIAGIDLGLGNDVQRLSIPGVMSIDFDYSLQTNERKNAFAMILGNWANVLDFYRSERAILGTVKLEYVV